MLNSGKTSEIVLVVFQYTLPAEVDFLREHTQHAAWNLSMTPFKCNLETKLLGKAKDERRSITSSPSVGGFRKQIKDAIHCFIIQYSEGFKY